ncbi:MAG: pseudouridine synthase [Pseudomonadales bacterium]
MSKLVLLNKPYDTLCQFRDSDGRATLADLVPIAGVYPAGRLDRDSEGLLLLTDDGALQAKIAHPKYKLAKSYWVQVEGEITPEALTQLAEGVTLNDGTTKPAQAKAITEPAVWQRDPPIRQRKNIPTSWLELSIKEGRNRQVRRMTAAVGFPTLRLIRHKIGEWSLADLQPGDYQVLELPSLPRSSAIKDRKFKPQTKKRGRNQAKT